MTQNSPRSQGAEPVGEELPQNPTPHGVEALRDAMLAQREMMRRIPAEYCYTEDEAVARMQGMVRDFTREEFRLLVKEGRVDWRFVEGRSTTSTALPKRCWRPMPTLPPARSTRLPPAPRRGSSATASMSRWSGTARQAPASP